jgi:hypothetical protein
VNAVDLGALQQLSPESPYLTGRTLQPV